QIFFDDLDQFLRSLEGNELIVLYIGYRSRFFADDQTNGIGLFRNSHGGPMSQSETKGDVPVIGHGQDYPGGRYKIVLDHDGPIVQGAVLEENTLQYGLGDLYVHDVPRSFDEIQGIVPFDHDKCPRPGARHTFTGPDYGLYIGIGGNLFLL